MRCHPPDNPGPPESRPPAADPGSPATMKPTPIPEGVETVSQWSDKLLAVPLDTLRFRRDRAVRCGDLNEALACVIAIDKKRDLYGSTPQNPEKP